jgi:hypothetical protein
MEVWASRYGKQVQFLMVCVDAAGVAIQFGKMFGLKNVINCWIPSRGYMPVGCVLCIVSFLGLDTGRPPLLESN